MRTTLTLNDDVAALLERVRKQRNATLKEVVNEALRRGLDDLGSPKPVETFKTRTVSLGGSIAGNLDNVAEVLALAEAEDFGVILIDANLLVYAHVKESPHHEQAHTWLDSRLSQPDRVGLPWSSILGFVRLVSNPRIYRNPESVADAWDQAKHWLDAEPGWIPLPTQRHRQVLETLMPHAVSPNLVPDAHLAALAIEHGLELFSTDGDFARFPGLRWQNPLQ